MLDLDSTSTLTARAGSSAITPLRYNYCPLPGRGRPITRLFNPLTTRVLALHTTCTALHCHYYCPCLSPFPDPTIVHYPPPSPRLDTSLLLLLSPSFFTPGSGTHWPPFDPTCPLCLSSNLRRPQSHPSSLLESGAQPHLYINFLSLSDETAIHAISQSGRHRRSKPSPGTLCCPV